MRSAISIFPAAAALALAAIISAQTPPATTGITTRASTMPVIDVDLGGTEVIDLWPAGAIKNQPAENTEVIQERVEAATGRRDRRVTKISHPNLTRFPLADAAPPAMAVIVIPGGGYSGEVIDREGYFIADRLRERGVAAFVLKYRLPNGVAPAADEAPLPQQDVQRAIRLLRSDAQKYRIDPTRIGVMGFSAGGHVAGSAATQFDAGDASASDPIARRSSRPDFAVLMYAVSSMHESVAHLGSRKALLGEQPSAALEDRFSVAQRVTAQTPPLLLIHAKDDKVVKIANSDEVAAAAKEQGVPCEYIVYDTGGHGFGLGAPGSEQAGWIDRFCAWSESLKTAR